MFDAYIFLSLILICMLQDAMAIVFVPDMCGKFDA
jgi:hypothetical protein